MSCCDSVYSPAVTTLGGVSVEELTPYGDLSFLGADSLLHAEVPLRSSGFSATATPYRLRHDGWSGLVLLVCLLLAANLVLRLGGGFRDLMRDMFFPIAGKKDEPVVDDPLRYSTRLVAVALLSLSAAMVSFAYTQHDVAFYVFGETPYLLFVAFFLLWLVYFLLKRMMGSFVGWVFFIEGKIFTWRRSYTLLLVLEAWLSFALALVVVYLPVSPRVMFDLALWTIVFVKILHLFKIYQIFFPNLYGTLHLFVYFCSLEIVPLLVLWRVLMYSELLSVVKI